MPDSWRDTARSLKWCGRDLYARRGVFTGSLFGERLSSESTCIFLFDEKCPQRCLIDVPDAANLTGSDFFFSAEARHIRGSESSFESGVRGRYVFDAVKV